MASSDDGQILIVGGGIAGLTLGLSLQAVGLGSRVQIFEAASELQPIGGGINLGPHATEVLFDLGLGDALTRGGVLPDDYAFFTSAGQMVYREAWGMAAGHRWPHLSIHRAELHAVLVDAVRDRLGPERLHLGHRLDSFLDFGRSVEGRFVTSTGVAAAVGSLLIGCDGVNSKVRAQLYPGEGAPRFHGINLWRGVVAHKPILTGRSIVRIGAMHSTLIVYPIRNDIDGEGTALLNWVSEVDSAHAELADWNHGGKLEDFLPVYEDWSFDWLNVPELLRSTKKILSYPMVDRDPLERWTFGRTTLLGDAAHPMFPRGGNGGAQSILDARCLAGSLASAVDDIEALQVYEDERRPATSRVVLQNRSAPPNLIVDTVEKRTGGKRFERLEDVVSQEELRTIFANYQRTAGYHVDLLKLKAGARHG